MNLNDDFSMPITASAADATWVPSPLPGVERRMLDRVGDEPARATSLVRYAPGSRFAGHVHGGGEEILVLEGVFSDESGDHPAGTYLRHPPGSSHAPFSRPGCLLFVKLRQFGPGDATRLRIDTRSAPWRAGLEPGLSVLPLHADGAIHTALLRWAPDTRFNAHAHPGGEEILVLEGVFSDQRGDHPAGTWLRLPCGSRHAPFTGPQGALTYVKVGHLGPGCSS